MIVGSPKKPVCGRETGQGSVCTECTLCTREHEWFCLPAQGLLGLIATRIHPLKKSHKNSAMFLMMRIKSSSFIEMF